MSFLGNLVTTKGRDAYNGAVKLIAKLDPESASEAQIAEWNDQAGQMAEVAVRAGNEAEVANLALANCKANYEKYKAAAIKLVDKNPAASEKAADEAQSFKDQLPGLTDAADAAVAWAEETRANAELAQRKVLEGREVLKKARMAQEQAAEAERVAKQRLADRERAAGIRTQLDTGDIALAAMKENAAKAQDRAKAANLRANVLGQETSAQDDVKKALAELEEPVSKASLADKLKNL